MLIVVKVFVHICMAAKVAGHKFFVGELQIVFVMAFYYLFLSF